MDDWLNHLTMTFTTIHRSESAVDACASAVRAAILGGELAVGARLPPERELAEKLGVSRLTLRAGLGKVAESGLLRVKQGSGYLVQDFRRAGGPELLPGLVALGRGGRPAAIAADLLRVRRHLARAVLESLVETAQAGCAQRVGMIVEEMAAVVARSEDAGEIAAADLAVVAGLLDETRSPVMALCLNPIVTVVTQMHALRDAMYAEPAGNVEGWRLLCGWLETRRADLIDVFIDELARRDEATLRRMEHPRRAAKKGGH